MRGNNDAPATGDRARTAFGERGAVWWHDGAPDFNRRMAAITCYDEWSAQAKAPQ